MRYVKTFFAALAIALAAAWAIPPAKAAETPEASAVCDGFGHCWMEISGQGDHVI